MIESQAGIALHVYQWRRKALRIGFTNGVFDILHVGHLSTLKYAKAHCDRLIVGVDDDDSVRARKGPDRPLQRAQHRATLIDALHMVDVVIIFSADILDPLICGIAPDVLIKGDEYIGEEVVGAAHADKVIYAPMMAGISTTELAGRR
jgi:D-beta-D-heptose 7-phosphate kinase / D-beta-D-heptose 1-phosphate adenosyltransferase